MFTKEEIRAVRYYIGDVRNLPEDGFWNDPKAYCLLNALFFPGIATETARLAEGKILNLRILEDVPRLSTLFRNLFSVFRKSAAEQEYSVCRVERFSDYLMMQSAGKTVSFTSTSKNGFLPAYQDRCGIALLRFAIPPGTPCIDMQKFFSHYAKSAEAEILLPPGLPLQFEKRELSAQEQTILDADGKPPRISCLVRVSPEILIPEKCQNSDAPEGNLAGIRIIQALNSRRLPDAGDVENYSRWKQNFIANQIKFLA